MDEQKIAFIYCYNDEKLLNESIHYIHSLTIPVGYEIEIIPVESASSMTAGYNFAMKQTDAKYKVFLHQDVFIINRDFISDILKIFQHNIKIGLLGMVGAKELPTNGIWWEAQEKYGKVYDSHTGIVELLSFNEPTNDVEYVQAIDGLIMVTQYDIPWREDIFNGWHFYDISHSVEFAINGYKVAVPKQKEPWCIHDCGIVNVKNGFLENKELFLKEYCEFLYEQQPLVSILIPAYNRPKYLEEALKSVINQTYKKIEIIICDDSTDENVKNMIQPYLSKYPNIKYYKNEENLFVLNWNKCFELSKGKYINYLMDDDLFHPRKIEKMVNYFQKHKNLSVVTSYREIIDEHGSILPPFETTRRLFNEDTIIDGIELGNFILKNSLNVIGEPTTAMFKRSDLVEKFGFYKGKMYDVINDLATWISLLCRGNVMYITEPLSYFRQHSGQNQKSFRLIENSISQHLRLIIDSRNDGFLSNDEDYKYALSNQLKNNGDLFMKFIQSGNIETLKDKKIVDSLFILLNELKK